MAITEALVARVVADTSERMKDPSYVQLAVGEFVEAQPHVSQYLSARASRLGGAQALVTLVFHAQILSECLREARGGPVPVVSFPTLDRAAQGDAQNALGSEEPALASYVASNVDEAPLRTELFKVALALVWATVTPARGAGKRGR